MRTAFPSATLKAAVIGAGVAGAACAAGLVEAGFDVTVFDKSRGVGGRLATRRALWVDAEGVQRSAHFDHGAPSFVAHRPAFRAVVDRARARHAVAPWRQHVYAPAPAARMQEVFVPTPNMPAFCRHLLGDVSLRLGHQLRRMHRRGEQWQLEMVDSNSTDLFDQVILAVPSAQAAPLLEGIRDDWADTVAEARMLPCWTLMAITDDVEWPWDVVYPDCGPLRAVIRNDRKPGRSEPLGHAYWVVHADPLWSVAHRDHEAASVCDELSAALKRLLPRSPPIAWHHQSVHRWRYAHPADPSCDGPSYFWDSSLGLGLCGDMFGEGTVESAWASGNDMAGVIADGFENEPRAIAGHRAPVHFPLETHMKTHRRAFLMTIAAGATALSLDARAQATLDEKDAQAVALGYVADSSRADAKKYPQHAATQACGNCALYQGKAGDAAGACPLFGGKQVSAKGWCSAWAKKAA